MITGGGSRTKIVFMRLNYSTKVKSTAYISSNCKAKFRSIANVIICPTEISTEIKSTKQNGMK